MIHQETQGLFIKNSQIREVTDILLSSTNSSFLAMANYAFAFLSLIGIPPIRYVRVTIPDCFTLDFSSMLIRFGRTNGAIEYTDPKIFSNNPNQLWF